MPDNVRALVFVLVLAVPAFYIGRQLTTLVTTHREFAVWRNAWIATTVAAFLSGSFFIFAGVAAMVCLYAYAARAMNVALFIVLLFAAPLISVPIGGFGLVNMLFEINNGRLLAIILLLPILLATGGLGGRNGRSYELPDWLIVGYVVLLIALQFEKSDATQIMRYATMLALDVLVPYFAFSRRVTSIADLRRVLLAFIIAVLPLSLIAMFETAKGWLLYSSIAGNWGVEMVGYLRREGLLRASASAISPIVLGFVVMVAIGCVLALRQSIGSRRFAGIALTIFGAGLVCTVSRGPWIGAAVLVLVFLAAGPNAVGNFGRLAVITAAILLLLLLMPFGDRLLDWLPFIGSLDAGSVTYRQRLFENAMRVIERNPWLGSTDYMATPEMQEMMQGEGIIDIVNSYLKIALDSGLVGLGLFLGFFGIILLGLRRVLKLGAIQDSPFSPYARALMATLIAILVTIATASSIDFIPYVYWSFAGLSVALIRIAYRERTAAARVAHARRVPA
jgi:O-antigen ligase